MTNNLMIFTIFRYIICILTITLSDALAGDLLLYNNRKPTDYFVNHESQILELRNKLLKHHTVGVTGITGKGKCQ